MVCLLAFCLTQPVQAQDSNCKDYFTAEWAEPLDINGPGDILYNIVPMEVNDPNPLYQQHPNEWNQLTDYLYDNGTVWMTTTGTHGYFRILTAGYKDRSRGK